MSVRERKALIRNFVEGIEVMGDEATLTYTVPMPSDGAMSESASVLDFVKSGPPTRIRTDSPIFGALVAFVEDPPPKDVVEYQLVITCHRGHFWHHLARPQLYCHPMSTLAAKPRTIWTICP